MATKKPTTKRGAFTVKGVEWKEVEFNLNGESEMEEIDQFPSLELLHQEYGYNDRQSSSNVSEIIPHKFLDSKKCERVLWPYMQDESAKGNTTDDAINGNNCTTVTGDAVIEDTICGLLPEQSSNPCRNCHLPYTSRPLGCPINQILRKGRYIYITEKLFCRLECVKSYIIGCLSMCAQSSRYNNSLGYLSSMRQEMYPNSAPCAIELAAPLDLLEIYGGHLPVSEYKSKTSATYSYPVSCGRMGVKRVSAPVVIGEPVGRCRMVGITEFIEENLQSKNV